MEECTIEGCSSPLRNKKNGLCHAHYTRLRRYGSAEHYPARGWPLGKARSTGEFRRGPNGERRYPRRGYRRERVNYRAVHHRLSKTLGRASDYPCVDCGGTADEWSLNTGHEVIYDQTSYDGHKPYSLDPEAYSPRCFADHRENDRKAAGMPAAVYYRPKAVA